MPKVFFSTVIESSIKDTWNKIRDFGRLAEWHPLIQDCVIENNDPADRIGCIRRFHLDDGSQFREKLLAIDDDRHVLSYAIVDSPLLLENYIAKMKLKAITDNDWTFASWSSTFDCPVDSSDELSELVANSVYKAGLESVKQQLQQE